MNLNYKRPPSSHRLAKFGGDRLRGFRDFSPKPFTPNFSGGRRPPNLRTPKSKGAHLQSCVKVSGRSPQPSRRYSAAKCHKKTTAKHKPTWNYRSGWPKKRFYICVSSCSVSLHRVYHAGNGLSRVGRVAGGRRRRLAWLGVC